MRNQVAHTDKLVNIQTSIKTFELRIMEQLQSSSIEADERMRKEIRWCKPDAGIVKLNVDDTLLQNVVALAVIAQDNNGNLLEAWSKLCKLKTLWWQNNQSLFGPSK
jgi:hypothetical protein